MNLAKIRGGMRKLAALACLAFDHAFAAREREMEITPRAHGYPRKDKFPTMN